MNFLLRSCIVILFLAIISSCSPTQRLNRLIKRNPHLLELKDTITVRDTVRFSIPSVRADTVISILQARDTVYFQKEFIHVKTYIKGDSIYIEAKTDPVEKIVIRTKKIPVQKIVYRKPRDGLSWLELLACIFCLLFLEKIITDTIKSKKS